MGHAGHNRTKEQMAALQSAYEALLAAPFDHFLIVAKMKDEDEQMGQDPDVFYRGNYMMARVLAEMAIEKVTRQRAPNVRPRRPNHHA